MTRQLSQEEISNKYIKKFSSILNIKSEKMRKE